MQPNMLALYSFGQAVHREWGRDQFLAVYASAAVTAGLASHLATVGPLLSSSALRAAMRMGRCASTAANRRLGSRQGSTCGHLEGQRRKDGQLQE